MSDGFFDVPAGYNDADLEMAELEAEGSRMYRMWKRYTAEQRAILEGGGRLEVGCTNKETGERYTAIAVYSDDIREIEWTMPGLKTYHSSAKAARLALERAQAASVVES